MQYHKQNSYDYLITLSFQMNHISMQYALHIVLDIICPLSALETDMIYFV